MADNIDVTPGTGKTIAADEVSSALHQRVKLSLGADGSATDALGGAGGVAAGVLRSTLASDDPAVVALQSLLAKHWAFDVVVAPTVTSGAYGAGDIMGAMLDFANVARANDEMFIITGAQVVSKAAVTPVLTLVLFSADPSSTTKTDNAAYSLNAADAFKVIATIPLTSLFDHGTPNSWLNDSLAIPTKPVSGGRNIYGLLIDATGVTLTSTSDIQVRLRGIGA